MDKTFYRPTWAEIDLDIISHNLMQFRKRIPEPVKLMAVVKANGYGHGAVMIAREALESGAEYLGVATLDEGVELRRAGIKAPILILGYTPLEAAEAVVKWGLTQTVFSIAMLEGLDQAARRHNMKVKVHLKIDTGMGRIGLRTNDQIFEFINELSCCPNVELEGLFTHHACADESDKSFANLQQTRLQEVLMILAEEGLEIPLIHAGNSAVAIDHPSWAYNIVRIGISLYGFYPSPEVDHTVVDLKPALTLKSRIAMVKEVEAGCPISYGGTYQAKTKEKIATVPIGYGDGYSRLLSNRARALVKGREVPIVGRVCMDQIMLNVTDIPEAIEVGDEVVLYGQQNGGNISIDRVAAWMKTINYEVVCMISRRVPRVYLKGGRIIHAENYLNF